MAAIVGAIGVPHTPAFPAAVAEEGEKGDTYQLFSCCRAALENMSPDVLVVFDTDHLNTLFFDNLPVFAIGIADAFSGPNDETPALSSRTVPSHRELALHIRSHCVEADFDLVMLQKYAVDHSIMVPLHFITPRFDIPVVPIFIGGHVAPLPSAKRCHALGAAVTAAIASFPDDLRVAVIGSGSFSLDVWGTRISPGQSFGVPDPDWAAEATDLVREAKVGELVERSTAANLSQAGNVSGEILNWIAMLAATNAQKPDFVCLQARFGHAYAAWGLGER